MLYKEHIAEEMVWLARQGCTFIGENLINAGRIYGTLDPIPLDKCIEMPVAENLIMGSAIGMALAGALPVVVFQRMDFMTVAADAIINHLALLPKLSGGQFNLPVIIRAIIGSQDPAFVMGPQHNKDLTNVFNPSIATWEYHPGVYQEAFRQAFSILIVERKDLYETNCASATR
jgi:pyruvate/2-oxoglutarate/acetoin dehydrogenase E1 component